MLFAIKYSEIILFNLNFTLSDGGDASSEIVANPTDADDNDDDSQENSGENGDSDTIDAVVSDDNDASEENR